MRYQIFSDMEWLFGDSDDREGKKKNFLANLE